MNPICGDQEFNDQMARLNTLYRGCDAQWVAIKAQKEHTDAFGDPISSGHLYYGRKTGFHETIRLSRKSMEMFLSCFFENNAWLSHITEHLLKEQREMARKKFDQIEPSFVRRRLNRIMRSGDGIFRKRSV
ncbi:MAG: hypothetical protein HY401_03980 [Elusimicrobia bacterium]|nr:hypothetical protein [Elusimicrobiota bacterium]